MQFLTGWHHASGAAAMLRVIFVLAAVLLALPFRPATGQVAFCVDCTMYAITELNLRQEPDLNAPVLRFVPAAAAVHREAGKEVNTYAPVTYEGVSGWVVALGLVTSPEEIATTNAPATAVPAAPAAPVASANLRLTLEPLLLRSGPSAEAEPILTMPAGAALTLTREGAENGYVTVDYEGTLGWAYADLIATAAEYERLS